MGSPRQRAHPPDGWHLQPRAPAGARERKGLNSKRQHVRAPGFIVSGASDIHAPLRGAGVIALRDRWVRPLTRTSHRLHSLVPPGHVADPIPAPQRLLLSNPCTALAAFRNVFGSSRQVRPSQAQSEQSRHPPKPISTNQSQSTPIRPMGLPRLATATPSQAQSNRVKVSQAVCSSNPDPTSFTQPDPIKLDRTRSSPIGVDRARSSHRSRGEGGGIGN